MSDTESRNADLRTLQDEVRQLATVTHALHGLVGELSKMSRIAMELAFSTGEAEILTIDAVKELVAAAQAEEQPPPAGLKLPPELQDASQKLEAALKIMGKAIREIGHDTAPEHPSP